MLHFLKKFFITYAVTLVLHQKSKKDLKSELLYGTSLQRRMIGVSRVSAAVSTESFSYRERHLNRRMKHKHIPCSKSKNRSMAYDAPIVIGPPISRRSEMFIAPGSVPEVKSKLTKAKWLPEISPILSHIS